jgi:hypothetical protein
MLARRLARRGFMGVLVAVALRDAAASACLSPHLVSLAMKAASLSTAGGATAKAILSAKVIALAEGVLNSMAITNVKIAVASLLIVTIVGVGAGGLISGTRATEVGGGTPSLQEQSNSSSADLHGRVMELKQKVQHMQSEIAKLEQDTKPSSDDRSVCDGAVLANLFKYRVPFEIGVTQNSAGGRIEIREVWGTRPRVEIGGQYLVRGKYVMPHSERGKLYFYATASDAWGAMTSTLETSTLDLQSTEVHKQEGDFALVHGMSGPGYFHLVLAARDDYSRCFANVYFGTGDNVLRKKSW